LSGRQLAKGMPWQITLSSPQITELRAQLRRTKSIEERGIMSSSLANHFMPAIDRDLAGDEQDPLS